MRRVVQCRFFRFMQPFKRCARRCIPLAGTGV